jgi:apolipoprotein N-acyltransferase
MKKRTNKYLLLSVLSGILLSMGWPSTGFPFLLLTAFLPLLYIENEARSNNQPAIKKRVLFLYFYTGFFVWNLLTTWWIAYATFFGAAFAIVFNSLFMAIVFLLFHITRNAAGRTAGYFSLVAYWVAFEYLHLNWELSWSWLNLGNGFANYPSLVQWYEYTGTLGGSAWILIINILIFATLLPVASYQLPVASIKRKLYIIILILVIIIPLCISLYSYKTYSESEEKIEAVAVQPNIDPYHEKFGGLSLEEQLGRMLSLAEKKVTKNTNLLVFPETALSEGVWENRLQEEPSVLVLKDFIKKFPQLKIVIGMSSYKAYTESSEKSETARKFSEDKGWYDAYNTAMYMDSTSEIQLYHKSKLVPGVERMPYPGLLRFLDKYSINMGGITGSLGMQEDRTPFKSTIYDLRSTNEKILNESTIYDLRSTNKKNLYAKETELIIAPAICYESVYGEFMSRYIINGGNLLCIITNDGWWGETAGYRQHFQYARLRAVETRRSIVRSANTGISGFINQKGDIIMKTCWWKSDAINNKLSINNKQTFYVRYGDYSGRIFLLISAIIILYTVVSCQLPVTSWQYKKIKLTAKSGKTANNASCQLPVASIKRKLCIRIFKYYEKGIKQR